jgi:hypothetical protein
VVAILTLAALLLQAGQTSFATVQGILTRAGTGDPLRDVRVTLQQDADRVFTRITVSDSAGHFAFPDLPPGRYTVSVQREGFSTSPSLLSTVTVAAGGSASANLSLVPDGIVRGRVLDSAGRFVANATVQALSVVYVNGTPSLRAALSRTTDDRGEYRLFGVPPGEYYISAAPPSTPVAASVRNVRTYYRSSPTFADATTIHVNVGEEIAGIDLLLQTEFQVAVSGRVLLSVPSPPNAETQTPATSPDAPGTTARLSLLPRERDSVQLPDSRPVTSVPFKGAVAEFEIKNVIPGQYDLLALVLTPQGFLVGRTPITLIDRDLTGIFVVTQPGVDLRGTVTVDGSVPSRLPEIALQPTDSLRSAGFEMPAQPQDQTPGAFRFPGVPDGRFRLSLNLPANLYVEDILQGSRSVYDSGFDVRTGPSQDALQVLLKSGTATMEGVVSDASEKAVAAATVALVPLERRSNPALYRSVATDSAGRFSFNGIAPGEYKLFAWRGNVNGAFFDSGFLSNYEDDGRRIVIAPGSRNTLRVTVLERK